MQPRRDPRPPLKPHVRRRLRGHQARVEEDRGFWPNKNILPATTEETDILLDALSRRNALLPGMNLRKAQQEQRALALNLLFSLGSFAPRVSPWEY